MKHKEAQKYLKMAQSQIEASLNMIEEDRYCIDVSHQILASIALLKKANLIILKEHMHTCVVDAVENNNQDKIDEVLLLVDKMTK